MTLQPRLLRSHSGLKFAFLLILASLSRAEAFHPPLSSLSHARARLSPTQIRDVGHFQITARARHRSSCTPLLCSTLLEESMERKERTFSEIWGGRISSDKMMEIRSELIDKYIEHGLPLSYAEDEVDAFLSDKERSTKYIEMRLYSLSQADFTPIEFFQMLMFFLLGMSFSMQDYNWFS